MRNVFAAHYLVSNRVDYGGAKGQLEVDVFEEEQADWMFVSFYASRAPYLESILIRLGLKKQRAFIKSAWCILVVFTHFNLTALLYILVFNSLSDSCNSAINIPCHFQWTLFKWVSLSWSFGLLQGSPRIFGYQTSSLGLLTVTN